MKLSAKITRDITDHWISQEVVARAIYSASKDDLEMVSCFFDFQDMSESPKKTQ